MEDEDLAVKGRAALALLARYAAIEELERRHHTKLFRFGRSKQLPGNVSPAERRQVSEEDSRLAQMYCESMNIDFRKRLSTEAAAEVVRLSAVMANTLGRNSASSSTPTQNRKQTATTTFSRNKSTTGSSSTRIIAIGLLVLFVFVLWYVNHNYNITGSAMNTELLVVLAFAVVAIPAVIVIDNAVRRRKPRRKKSVYSEEEPDDQS
jgi:hypothetical protein